jgi:nitroimidazol reductase NimA-like FMN-containing flavoprotein (pyridoxamine 5'-phosphate oxidase superfamily)
MTTRKRTADSQTTSGAMAIVKSLPPAAGDRALRTLNPANCFDLLEPGGIGRVGLALPEGVVMLPVNFAIIGREVYFRTAPDTLLALNVGARLSFEADHFDETLHEGWSVLVHGHAHQVTDERHVTHLERARCLRPWAPGARDVYVRITPTQISGRRIQRA